MSSAAKAHYRVAAIAGHMAAAAGAGANPGAATVMPQPTAGAGAGDAKSKALNEVVIVGVARTPLGGLAGSLSALSGPQLGAIAIKAALQRAKVAPKEVQEVFMGCVLQANVGQAPARQAALGAGLPNSVPCTTVNKVCASGMKAVMFAAQAIQTGYRDVVVAGGFESMSQAPYYLPKAARSGGLRMGNAQLTDGMIGDGLWDPYTQQHMGSVAEQTAKKYDITRQQQDDYAIASYQRAQAAHTAGAFKAEIVPVTPPAPKTGPAPKPVTVDDEPFRVKDFEKVRALNPSFGDAKKGVAGTITAANASVISDGAAALVLMSRAKAQALGCKVLATVTGFSDAAGEPTAYPTAPALAIPQALKHAGISVAEVDLYEVNEAFAVVVLANMKLLGIAHDKMNVLGGAVSLGHPIGCSGARILITLLTALEREGKRTGCAAICNGGGGASALVLKRE